MPCNTITTQSVKLANAMPDLVTQALTDAGWTVREKTATRIAATGYIGATVIWEQGKGLTFKAMQQTSENQINRISQAYSKRAVTWAAQRAGWSVSRIEQNNVTLTKG